MRGLIPIIKEFLWGESFTVVIPICKGCQSKDDFIEFLKDEIKSMRNPVGIISSEEIAAPDIAAKKKGWSQVQRDLEAYEKANFPDAKEEYWRRVIARQEEKINASQISETVSADAGSSAWESEGIGAEPVSSEGISEQDES